MEGRRGVAGAAAIVMAGFLASRLTGLLRHMVFSYQFGTSPQYAAYLAANQIPDFIFQVMAGGAVAAAFIPVFTQYLAQGREEEAWRVVSALFHLALLALMPVILLLMLLAPQVIGALAPGFDPSMRALAADLTRLMLIMPLFFTWGCLAASVLNSYQRFLLPAMAPTMYNLGLIAGALAGWGVYGLALGAVVGAALFLVVQVPGLLQARMRYRPALGLAHPGVRQVAKLMLPRALGLGVAQVNFLIALYLASGMPERYAALNYAWLLTMLPLGLFAMAPAIAVFPTLAEQSARQQIDELRATVTAALRWVLYLTVPASVGLILLRVPVIQLLFERGDFGPPATQDTAFALQFYAAALFAHAMAEILTRAFYALQDTRTPLLAGAGAMLANAALSVGLVRPLAHGGLALALSVASAAEALALLFLLRRRLVSLADEGRLWASVRRACLSAALMGLALYGLAPYLFASPPVDVGKQALSLGLAMAGGALVYLGASWLLGSEEARQVSSAWRRK